MFETTKKHVYTIIVTYNGIKWIKDCLNSVNNETTVIVIDNNSSDNTVSFIKQNYPEIILLEQEVNLGFGKANNLGIMYALNAGADFVFLLNQDARVFGNAVRKLVDFSKKHSEYGIISPIHCDWSGEYLESSFVRYVNYENNEDFYSDFVLSKEIKEIYDVPFIAAACWFIPISVFETVGGFDPIFFHIGEDSNLAQRLLYHNYKIGVLSNCKIGHDTKNREYKGIKKYSEQYFYRNNYHRKVKYADVNLTNVEVKLKYLKYSLIKEALISIIGFKFSDLKGALKEIQDLKTIKRESFLSAKINKKKGRHYL